MANLGNTQKTSYEAGTYNIQSTQYPDDLYDNKAVYGGNYVVFYVNVPSESKFLPKGASSVVNSPIPARLRGDLVGLNLSGKEIVGAAATGGAIGGLVAGGVLSKSALVGAAKGAALGAIFGAAAQQGEIGRQQKRLTQAIALHVPNQLNINYTMEWQTEETFAFQAAAIANREIAKAVENGAKKNSNDDTHATQTVKDIAQAFALSKTPGIAGGLSAATGLAANPKKEQIFKSVNFREFTFDYTFSPRSEKEAQAVRNILYLFKLHMHPEYKDANNFIFVYPSEFDIYYYQNGKENANLHKHTSCVLKNMSINYTPNGAFNTFADGMPTQINVQLQFVELAILTKETVQGGF